MIKVNRLETSNLILMPYVTNEEEYVMKVHNQNSDYVFDDVDYPDNFTIQRKRINEALDANTAGWICWMKVPVIRVGIIYYSNIVPGITALVHPILDKENYRKYIRSLNGSYRRVQIMDEALVVTLKYIFSQLNLLRVSGVFFDYNSLAINLCKRNGFKFEGVIRHGTRFKGSVVDVTMLGIVREDVL